MLTLNPRGAKAGFSHLLDEPIKGAFVTITHYRSRAAAPVPVEAADIARFKKHLPAPPGHQTHIHLQPHPTPR